MNYLDELNEAQRAAVEAWEGPSMVIAGAGSGKTRVLTYRIAHLIHNGVDSFNILALTFTNKAAKEMKERIYKIVGNEAKNLWMGTFHSVFARILRAEAEKIGYPSNFTIYDTQDSKSLLKSIIKAMNLDDKVYKPGLVYNRISSAKNNLRDVNNYCNNSTIRTDDEASKKPLIGEIYKEYEKRCFKSNAMDFDDLLFKTVILFNEHPDVLLKYQSKFKFILVDEYQDTNFSQYLIVKKLAARFENICVVGDDAQSIYAFRGANIQNILNFKRDYPDVKTFKLEQNYRSTQNIVNAANSVIENNKEQLEKEVWTDNTEGERIKVSQSLTDNEEGKYIANEVFDIQQNHQARYSDFAILYRTNAQSRALEEALRKKNIPYRIYGGLSFYQRKEIKDILAYYRLSLNHNDEEALKRVINYPTRGIGNTTLEKLITAATTNDMSIWDVIQSSEQMGLGFNRGTLQKLNEFSELILSFSKVAENAEAYEAGSYIASHSGILKDLFTDKTPEGVARYENIQELLNGLKDFSESYPANNLGAKPMLADFMQDVALLTDADNDDKEDQNRVSLMTIHASKGLEFPYIIIAGLEENLFPSQLSLNSRSDLEEERRLFYVALTRAMNRIILSYSLSRYRWGNLIHNEPSRFIEEIDDKYLDIQKAPEPKKFEQTSWDDGWGNKGGFFEKNTTTSAPTFQKKKLKKVSDANFYKEKASADFPDIKAGTIVSHQKFGRGTVVGIEGGNKALIDFGTVGKKQLLLQYAKLEIVG